MKIKWKYALLKDPLPFTCLCSVCSTLWVKWLVVGVIIAGILWFKVMIWASRSCWGEHWNWHSVYSRLTNWHKLAEYNFVSCHINIFIVPGLWAACETISVFARGVEYQNPFILMQAIEDLIWKFFPLRLNSLCSSYYSQASTRILNPFHFAVARDWVLLVNVLPPDKTLLYLM